MPKLHSQARNGLNVATEPQTPMQQADSQVYGGLKELDTGRLTAKPISIFDIHPDKTQPRRAIPGVVLNSWNYGEMPHLFLYWNGYAGHERTRDYSGEDDFDWIEARITGVGKDEWEYIDSPGPVERSLLEVADLAASIYRDSLTNPITVVRRGDGYTIETGERRWLAFHLLFHLVDGDKWSEIPARVVPELDVFRQAAENGQRANLNAISKARQYAILLMAMYPETDLATYEHCISDRAYYAQALQFSKIPDGSAERFMSAFGVTSRSQLSSYRSFLKLPDDIWIQADDENWPEKRLFSALNNAAKSGSNGAKKRQPKPVYERLANDDDLKALKELADLNTSHIEGDETITSYTWTVVERAEKHLERIKAILRGGE